MMLNELERKAKTILRNAGDAISGERVIAVARKIGKSFVVPGSSKHQIQHLTLKKNVFCMIDKAFRMKDLKLRRTGQP